MHKNQKGFLIALCLCMLSLSGIYGAYQYRNGQEEQEEETPPESARTEVSGEEKEAANSDSTAAQLETKEEDAALAKVETEEDVEEIGEAELAQTEEEEIPEEEPSVEADADPAEAKRLSFGADSQLLWPVSGDVILSYSMDHSIYFSTLNQYKYHPAIVISAEVGSEVISAAEGTVTDIRVNEETGTTLTMTLGDDYEAVYGQLAEVAVQEGDTVGAGELLGYVSEPTKYYTVEGSSLYFQLLKDGEPVNPLDFLE